MALIEGFIFLKKTILKALNETMSITVDSATALFETSAIKFQFNGRINAQDPVDAGDLATKLYVDAKIIASGQTVILTQAGISEDSTFTDFLPAGYALQAVRIRETAGNAITSLIITDESAGGSFTKDDAITASVDFYSHMNTSAPTATLGGIYYNYLRFNPFWAADNDLYVTATAWNGGIVDIDLILIKIV